jgi:hypothetical protein
MNFNFKMISLLEFLLLSPNLDEAEVGNIVEVLSVWLTSELFSWLYSLSCPVLGSPVPAVLTFLYVMTLPSYLSFHSCPIPDALS